MIERKILDIRYFPEVITRADYVHIEEMIHSNLYWKAWESQKMF